MKHDRDSKNDRSKMRVADISTGRQAARSAAEVPVFSAGRRLAASVLVSAAVIGAASLSALPAGAQTAGEMRALTDRLQMVERDLIDLQRSVYSGEVGGQSYGTAGTAPGSAGGETPMARLTVRVNDLEASMRQLNGQVEELIYQLGRTQEDMRKLSEDMDFRLRELEGERSPAYATGAPGPAPGSGAMADAGPAAGGMIAGAAQAAPSGPSAGARGPKVLGTVPQNTANSQGNAAANAAPSELAYRTPTPEASAAPASGNAEQQYDYALNQLRSGNYSGAERSLNRFLDQFPDDALAGNAQYWLGETHYVRGEYNDAATAFLAGYTEYPNSTKAPDSLLKLGMTLAALGQKNEACVTLGELDRKFPNAPANISQRAKLEQQRTGC